VTALRCRSTRTLVKWIFSTFRGKLVVKLHSPRNSIYFGRIMWFHYGGNTGASFCRYALAIGGPWNTGQPFGWWKILQLSIVNLFQIIYIDDQQTMHIWSNIHVVRKVRRSACINSPCSSQLDVVLQNVWRLARSHTRRELLSGSQLRVMQNCSISRPTTPIRGKQGDVIVVIK
jgi:hypothetical protein